MNTQYGARYAGEGSDDYILSVGDLLRQLRRQLWLILLIPLVLAVVAVALASLRPPVYESTATILVGKQQEAEARENAPVALQSEAQEIQALIPNLVQAMVSLPVAEEIANRADLAESPGEVQADLSVAQASATQFIEITYQDRDREVVRRVPNSMESVISDRVLTNNEEFGGLSVRVWGEASTPTPTATSSVWVFGLGALVVGTVLSVGLAFLRVLLDARWRSPGELETVSGVPNFGVVPETAGSGAPEAYRDIRTGLLYASGGAPPRVIVVTSPGPSEGKSTTCAGLAVALARAEKSTLVLDCNFRDPAMGVLFDLQGSAGLVEILSGERDLADVWQEPMPGLMVVPAGKAPPEDADLLSSGRFQKLLDQVRGRFDHVLMDAPSAEPTSDAAILAVRADGVLLVMDAQRTRKESVRQALHKFRTLGADVLGTVMNNLETPKGDSKKPRVRAGRSDARRG